MPYWEFEEYIKLINEKNKEENKQQQQQQQQQEEQQSNMMSNIPKMPNINNFKPPSLPKL